MRAIYIKRKQPWMKNSTHNATNGVNDSRLDAKERHGCGTRFGLDCTGEGRDDDAASLGLPVRVQENQHDVKADTPLVTHQKVSTIAHSNLPTCSLYQFQASGLIGSPTLPRTRSVERSCPVTWCSPSLLKSLEGKR